MRKLFIGMTLCIISGCGLIDDDSNSFFANYKTQDLYNIEIHPAGSSIQNGFDATLEEVWHVISQHGYANAYPTIFGEKKGTTIANYMDIARGGYYAAVPSSYPDAAWYHYNDTSCEYGCQITEYFYWALTSILGAQDYSNGSETRLQQIQGEWELNTAAKVQVDDPNIYGLLTNGNYQMPTQIPNGNYAKSSEVGIAISSSLPDELSQIANYFTSYVSVFGIHIVATSKVENDKLLHAAYVMAEYLDNNEDGTVDAPEVLANMKAKNCVLTITYDSDEMESIFDQLD